MPPGGRRPEGAGCGAPLAPPGSHTGCQHARNGWLCGARGDARGEPPGARHAADRAPAGKRYHPRFHSGSRRLRGEAFQPHGTGGAAQSADPAMTWPAPSLVARGSLYAAVALMGAYLLLLLVLLVPRPRNIVLLRETPPSRSGLRSE